VFLLYDAEIPIISIFLSHLLLISSLVFFSLSILYQSRKKRKEFKLQRQFDMVLVSALLFIIIAKFLRS